LLTICSTHFTEKIYAANDVKIKKITVLGDSVAYGYGVDECDSFPNVLAKEATQISRLNLFYSISNLAVVGDDSTDLLDRLCTDLDTINSIKSSNYVIINIGSNNLLRHISAHALKMFNAKNYNELFVKIKKNMMKNIKALTEDQLLDQKINNGIKIYNSELVQIVQKIRSVNANVKIYMCNAYNPVTLPGLINVVDKIIFKTHVEKVCDDWIKKLNQGIAENSSTLGYKVVDIYSAIKKDGSNINSNLWQKRFDPHPTTKGYKLIAQLILNAMKWNYEFKDIDKETDFIKCGHIYDVNVAG